MFNNSPLNHVAPPNGSLLKSSCLAWIIFFFNFSVNEARYYDWENSNTVIEYIHKSGSMKSRDSALSFL